MQIGYNILWIDDEIQKIADVGDLERVTQFLTDLGFLPNIITMTDGHNLDDQLNNNQFDLFISDFNIQEGHHGDDLIKQIRNRKIFTDVLFYSSLSDVKSIAEKLLTVDRISFHSGRRGLIEKIEGLIQLTVKKLVELNATRGLITSETSDLDVLIEEMVMDLVFNRLKLSSDEMDKIVNGYIDDFLKGSPDAFSKKYAELGFEKQFCKIEANRKWSIFRDLLRKLEGDDIKTFLANNKSYYTDVISVRNKFSHAKAVEKEGKTYLSGFGPDGEEFLYDNDACIAIRKNLIAHKQHLKGLKTFLQS